MATKKYLGLDVGTKRIGLALGTNEIKIAYPFKTVNVDGNEIEELKKIVENEQIDTIVVGYPRNQQGEKTSQTEYTINFIEKFKNDFPTVVYQDESLSSITAENILKSIGKPYQQSDIDSKAAAIILQDYLEKQNA